MVGRGIYGNPWFFNPAFNDEPPIWQDKLKVMMEHSHLFLEIFGDHKHFPVMKKYYKGYVTDFPGAKELRIEVMEARDIQAVEAHVRAFFAAHGEDLDAPMSPERQPQAAATAMTTATPAVAE